MPGVGRGWLYAGMTSVRASNDIDTAGKIYAASKQAYLA
jgi:hypothetical protein